MNKAVLKLTLLNIDNDGYHLSVKAKINGKVAHLIIDTGASRTVFDLNRIGKFVKSHNMKENGRLSTGLGTNTMKSQVSELKRLELGSMHISNYKAIFLDLSHINVSYVNAGLNPIDGVVGSDILHDHKAIVDYNRLELILKPIEEIKRSRTKKATLKTVSKTKKKHVSKRR